MIYTSILLNETPLGSVSFIQVQLATGVLGAYGCIGCPAVSVIKC
jgi:hypothetical protein